MTHKEEGRFGKFDIRWTYWKQVTGIELAILSKNYKIKLLSSDLQKALMTNIYAAGEIKWWVGIEITVLKTALATIASGGHSV